MSEPKTVSLAPPPPFGLDFAGLRAEMIARVQRLSGEVWTDYNEHDPGVTIIEQLCYALTELGYRAGLPVAELLVGDAGRIDPDRHALFVGPKIFPCNPVVEADYRRLFVDRVDAVRNAWLEPLSPDDPLADGVRGLYRARIYAPSLDPCAPEDTGSPEGVIAEVERVYHANRALAEDLAAAATLLRERRTFLGGTLGLSADADPNTVLAEVQFAVATFLAPELPRRSLRALLDAGHSAESLLRGPLLERGLILDRELRPKLSCFDLRELAGVIADVEGVVAVSQLSLVVERDGQTTTYTDTPISVGADEVLSYVPSCEHEPSAPSLTLRRGPNRVDHDCAKVERRRRRRWAAYRREHPLADEYREALGMPRARPRPLATYSSIQAQFPTVYGINHYGVPDSAPAPRRAQAKQLKAYLVVFEQLLTNFFAQLAELATLYSRDRDVAQTYYWQSLCGAVPNLDPILAGGCQPGSGYEQGLAKIVERSDPVDARRNQLASFLLGLHAEQLDSASSWLAPSGSSQRELALIEAKLDLLDVLVESSRDRGRGFDYRASSVDASRDYAGMVLKTRIELGMGPTGSASFSDRLFELGLTICSPGETPSFGPQLSSVSTSSAQSFQPASTVDTRAEDEPEDKFEALREHNRVRGQRLSATLIRAGASLANYSIDEATPGGQATLLCALPGGGWSFLARYPDAVSAARGARQLCALLGDLDQRSSQLFVIEHVLLRAASLDPSPEPRPDDARPELDSARRRLARRKQSREDPYSLRITVVVATDEATARDPSFVELAAEVTRANTPAHLLVDLCILSPGELVEFEPTYHAWRQALELGDPDPLGSSSRQLLRLIERRRHIGDEE